MGNVKPAPDRGGEGGNPSHNPETGQPVIGAEGADHPSPEALEALALALLDGGDPDLSRLSLAALGELWRRVRAIYAQRVREGWRPGPPHRRWLRTGERATAAALLVFDNGPSGNAIVREILSEPLLAGILWALSRLPVSIGAVRAAMPPEPSQDELPSGGGWPR